MVEKHLIIGSGIAALSALRKIREINRTDEICLVTMENHPPYSLAALPYLISKRIDKAGLYLAGKSYIDKMQCSLKMGKKVIRIVPDAKEVVYQDHSRDNFNNLLIASGAEPIIPNIIGLKEVPFTGFHTLGDCERLQKLLADKKEVAIYGGGLVSLEIAASLLEAGYRVTIIVRSYIFRRYLDKKASEAVERIFRDHGCQIYSGSEIVEMRKNKNKVEIQLAKDGVIFADFFIVTTGVKSRTTFLEDSGIEVNQGIVVDRRMRTNFLNIYAAGDAAEAPDFFYRRPGVSAIAPSAIQQGRIAGANMAGETMEDKGWVPMNVAKFFGHSICSLGLPPDESSQVLRNEPGTNLHYKELIFRDNKLIGARFLDIDIDPGVFRYLIEQEVDLEHYKELLFEKPKAMSRWLMLECEKR
jgi:phenylglyoxylate dehydrogenase epsilon subunit